MPPRMPTPQGSNNLQRSMDSLDRSINTLASVLRVAGAAWNGGRVAVTPGGAQSQTQPGSTPAGGQQSGGRPNGGGATFGGQPMWQSAGGRLAFYPARSGRRGNGGHHSFGGHGGFAPPMGGGAGNNGGGTTGISLPVPSLNKAWQSIVRFGNEQMPDQMTLDQLVHWASMGGPGSAGTNRNAIIGNAVGSTTGSGTGNAIALSTQDAVAGEMIRIRTAGGWSTATPQGRTTMTGMRALGMANPSIGAAGAASMQRGLFTPRSYWALQQMGLGRTVQGGQLTSMSTIAQRLLQRTYGSSTVSTERMSQGLSASGMLNYNVEMVAQAAGWDPAQTEAFRTYLEGQNKAGNAGISASEYERLLAESAGGQGVSKDARERARDRLSGAGIDVRSMMQTQKDLKSTQAQRSGMINEEFSASMKRATKTVDGFNQALNKLLESIPGAKWLVGQTGGASAANSGMSQAGSFLRLFGAATGPLGAVMGGMVSMLGGDGGEGYTAMGRNRPSGGNTAKESGPTAGITASRVISLMQSQAGDRYDMGATGPNAWDCSSLVQWALKTAGMKNVPRTAGNIMRTVPGQWVDPKQVRPGDLLYKGHLQSGGGPNEHIAMYIGGGKTIEARGRKYGVGNFSASGRGWTHAKRIFGSVGDLGSLADNGDGGKSQSDLGEVGGGMNAGEYGSSEEAAAIMAALAGGTMTPTSYGGQDQAEGAGDGGEVPVGGFDGRTPESAKKLAKQLAQAYGWSGGSQWKALETLWEHESGWRYKADNPTSDAYGIPQALPGSKMGKGWQDNPTVQIKWGLKYIKQRYGSPAKAWSFWQSHNWYDKGAWEVQQDETARIHKGEMVLPARQAQVVRDAIMQETAYGRRRTNGADGGKGDITMTFAAGSIVFQVQGAVTESTGRDAARVFAEQLAKEDLYNKIATGVG